MFSLNLLYSVTKISVIRVKGLEPATSCTRDQDATTTPARHMWETASIDLNWLKFMIQWFISGHEFAEFSEFLFHIGKTPMAYQFTRITPISFPTSFYCNYDGHTSSVIRIHQSVIFNGVQGRPPFPLSLFHLHISSNYRMSFIVSHIAVYNFCE